jgi:predicted enzyme related to lactoylglutathione lyase
VRRNRQALVLSTGVERRAGSTPATDTDVETGGRLKQSDTAPVDSANLQRAGLRIEIFPTDLDPVVDFYTRVLRFRLARDERTTMSPYVALERGPVRIGAARREDHIELAFRRPPGGTEIVLEVSDVRAERDWVAGQWPLEEDLVARPWGLVDFRVLDPAGYYLRLTEFERGDAKPRGLG